MYKLPGLEIREYGHRDPSRWPRGTIYPQKLALTSPRSGGRSASIVHLQTQAKEFWCRNYKLVIAHTIKEKQEKMPYCIHVLQVVRAIVFAADG
jgi:hypothetical protein